MSRVAARVGLLVLAGGVVACGSTEPTDVGTLTVVVSTAGTVPAGGYLLTVAGQPRAVAAVDSVELAGIPAGSIQASLGGLPSGCAVTGANPLVVALPARGHARAAFGVVCSPLAGNVAVTVRTSGRLPDPDGYTLGVGGADPRPLPANGTILLTALPTGDLGLTLGGLAANCQLLGAASRGVIVSSDRAAEVTFEVNCPGPLDGRIVFATSRFRTDGRFDLASSNPDGSDVERITLGPFDAEMPTVSPDRRTIAFAVGSFTPTERHLAFVRSDGTGLRHLPAIADASEPGLSANGTYQPVWSPDGAHIAFLVEMSGGAGSRLWVMNADGTGARKLSATDFPDWYYLVERSPAWSPDGTRLLFSRDSNRVNFTSYAQLRTIRVDGSDLQAVPTGGVPAWGGDWSPAGDRIAFVGSTTSGNTLLMDLYVVGIDGSALVRVTNTPGQEGAVRWSPDGASLVFGSDFVVKRVRPDGTGLADVTSGRDPWWVR